MSDADWDADDFEPNVAPKTDAKVADDKWDGEDEDDDIKEAWDNSDKSGDDDENGDKPRAVQRKKKKKLQDILAEKEAAKIAELEAKATEAAAKKSMNTPEAKLAEKMKLQKLEENANLQLAKDMLGLEAGKIDGMAPVTKEEFEEFEKALVGKISSFVSSECYQDFAESLIQKISLDLTAPTLKKIKMNAEALHTTKLKDEKAAKAKKGKGKGASLKFGTERDLFASEAGGGYEDIDDFM